MMSGTLQRVRVFNCLTIFGVKMLSHVYDPSKNRIATNTTDRRKEKGSTG